jgi:hydrocephalus-inducing protein
MIFNLRVASDGETRDIMQIHKEKTVSTASKNMLLLLHNNGDLNASKDKKDEDYNFKEFSITPSTGIIPAQSEIKLMVEFVPHFIKKYETSLIVDIEDVGTDLFSLPISARSTVPKINLLTGSVDLGRCFVFHSYERFIKLSNETSLKARYYLVPSKSTDQFKFHSHQAEVWNHFFYSDHWGVEPPHNFTLK